MELVGLLLGLIHILQGIDKKEQTADKIKVLKEAFNKGDVFFRILRDAKQIHDGFETLERSVLDNYKKVARSRDLTQTDIEKLTNNFLITCKMVLNLPITFVNIKASTLSDTKPMPTDIRGKLEQIEGYYPDMIRDLNTFTTQKSFIKDNHIKGNYGDDFKQAVCLMCHSVAEACMSADKVILNVSTIIDYMNTEMKNYVEKI
jgi:hypothetical protein